MFSTLDTSNGYWHGEVKETDQDKTAFRSYHGLNRFERMPFGLKNAPKTIQRAMDVILSPVKWEFAKKYFNNIIVISHSLRDHIEHLRSV